MWFAHYTSNERKGKNNFYQPKSQSSEFDRNFRKKMSKDSFGVMFYNKSRTCVSDTTGNQKLHDFIIEHGMAGHIEADTKKVYLYAAFVGPKKFRVFYNQTAPKPAKW